MESEKYLPYLLVLPAIAITSLMNVYAFYNIFYMSFFRNVRGTFVFVGLDNFMKFFSLSYAPLIVRNTIIYTGGQVFFKYILGLAVALLLNQEFKGRSFYRVIIMLSWAMPNVVIAVLFKWMYHPIFGVINYFLIGMGVTSPPNWLVDDVLALPTAMTVGIWGSIPFVALILLAALESIPEHLYEQAQIDGANILNRFRHITLPGIRTVSVIVVFMLALGAIGSFEPILIMTKGGPLHQSETMGYSIWRFAFQKVKLEEAYAQSLILLVASSAIIFFYVRKITEAEK